MTVSEARRTVAELQGLSKMSEEEEFIYSEALQFLINETHDNRAMLELGGWYYEQKKFDLALKYYPRILTGVKSALPFSVLFLRVL